MLSRLVCCEPRIRCCHFEETTEVEVVPTFSAAANKEEIGDGMAQKEPLPSGDGNMAACHVTLSNRTEASREDTEDPFASPWHPAPVRTVSEEARAEAAKPAPSTFSCRSDVIASPRTDDTNSLGQSLTAQVVEPRSLARVQEDEELRQKHEENKKLTATFDSAAYDVFDCDEVALPKSKGITKGGASLHQGRFAGYEEQSREPVPLKQEKSSLSSLSSQEHSLLAAQEASTLSLLGAYTNTWSLGPDEIGPPVTLEPILSVDSVKLSL